MRKKAVAFALVICMVLGVMPVMASARFSDVNDTRTEENIAVLQTLGVIDGYPDGSFRPNEQLTRAQFTKMAVTVTKSSSVINQYKNLTIFPDVRATHWAAGYVNYAVKEAKILVGMPDGTFGPDSYVTFGQAVTILMRLMGYTDELYGANWPMGYIAEAQNIGLTDNISSGANDNISRAQAAQLFRNLLTSVTAEDTRYIDTIASSTTAGVIISSNNATAADGSTGAVSLVGTMTDTLKPVGKIPDELVGRQGTVALNSRGQILCFIPDSDTTSKAVTVATAEATYVTDRSGTKTNIAGDTPFYIDGEKTTWSAIWMDIKAGDVLTLFFGASGKCEYGTMISSTTTGAVAVLMSESPSGANPFVALLGLPSGNYNLVKNGAAATAADLRQYDVATYDPTTRTIYVSDYRLCGIYESASPNKDTPETIRVLGHDFDLVGGASEDISGINLGSNITLLLTADRKVAGVLQGNYDNGTAVGVVTSSDSNGIEIEMLNGLTLKSGTTLSGTQASAMEGEIVSVYSYRSGTISVNRLSASAGTFNVANRTVGSSALSESVRIFDKVGNKVKEISIGDILTATVPASKVVYAGKNYANEISVLVLNDATGDCYDYGLLHYEMRSESDNGFVYTNSYISVTNSAGESEWIVTGHASSDMNGKYGGIAKGGNNRTAGVVLLTALNNVPRSSFSGGYVTYNGIVLPISDDVQCYIKDQDRWTDLASARAYSDNLTVYYDKTVADGGKVRVVIAN